MSTRKYDPLSESLQKGFEADDPDVAGKRTERELVEVVKRLTDYLGSDGHVGALPDLDPDVTMEIHAPTLFPFVRRAEGIDEVRAAIVHNFSIVEDQRPTVLRVVAQGDVVDVLMAETGRIRPTGRRYDGIAVLQFVFRNDKVLRFLEVIAPRTPDAP